MRGAGASCLELEPGVFLVQLPGTRWTAFVQRGSQTAQKPRRSVGLYFPPLALNLSRFIRQVCELLLGIKKTLIFHQNKSSSAFLTVYKETLGFNTKLYFLQSKAGLQYTAKKV